MGRRGSADGYHWGRAGEEVARAGRMGSGGGIGGGRLDDGRELLRDTVWSKQTNAVFVGSSRGRISRYGWKERAATDFSRRKHYCIRWLQDRGCVIVHGRQQ